MSFQKILILGAGAIGSAIGALLSQKNNVTLIGRQTHVNAISNNGLTLSGNVNREFFLKAETTIKEIPSNTLVILTTKAYDAPSAIERIKPLLKEDTTILALPNGLDIKNVVAKASGGTAEVVRGLVTAAAEFFESGKVSFWQGETILEPSQSSKEVAKAFNRSGLKATISDDMKSEIWKKLIVNCIANPLTAILQVRNNEIMVHHLKETRHEIFKECIAVGKAEEISFEASLEDCVARKIAGYENYSSMCQDIMKRKKTEIAFLNGKIVELGRDHDIPTPVNKTLVNLIKFMEAPD